MTETTTVKVNSTTLDALYARCLGIKKFANALYPAGEAFTVGWLADGIVYASRTSRLGHKAEYALVNMSEENIIGLVQEAIEAEQTMGSMGRWLNSRFA